MNMPEPLLSRLPVVDTDRIRCECLLRLIRLLDRKNIPYALLGDVRDYPYQVDSDVDIVLPNEKARRFVNWLITHESELGMRVVQVIRHEQTAWYIPMVSDNTRKPIFLIPDVCGNYYRDGVRFLSAEELLDGRYKKGDLHIPAPAMNFIYYLLKRLDKEALEQNHFEFLRLLFQEDMNAAIRQIRRFWPDEKDSRIIIAAFQDSDYFVLQQATGELRRQFRRHLRISLKDRWRKFQQVMDRFFHPTGLTVAFLGLDGSGKSTVIQQVTKQLAPAFRRCEKFHLRPGVPIKSDAQYAPNKDPHGQANRYWLTSCLKVLFFGWDFTAGFIKRVYPLKVKSSLNVFDRYFDDLLVDPRRFRYGGPRWLPSLVQRLIFKPDLYIILDAPPDVLYARKQEVPLPELAQQREKLNAFHSNRKNSIRIDASQPVDMVCENAGRAILEYMESRVKRRFGHTS